MALGPGFEIKNCTQWPVTVSFEMAGPLYWGLVQPGETFARDTGAVWFTLKAVSSPDNVCHVTDMDAFWSIAKVVGAVILGAVTGGASAFVAVGASVGASALVTGGAVSLGAILVEGATGGVSAVVVSAGMAAQLFGNLFTKTGVAQRDGMYAGPPWPFREARKQFSIVGGPVASATPDGRLLLSPGDPLRIVDDLQPYPFTATPNSTNWRAMPGALKTMSMIRRGLMMGALDSGAIVKWDGSAWTAVPGELRSISAASDGTVWGIDMSNRPWRWEGTPDWHLISAPAMDKIAVGSASKVWGILNKNSEVCVWSGTEFKSSRESAKDIAGASDGTLWQILGNNKLSRADQFTGKRFGEEIGGALEQVSVGGANLIWGVMGGNVYRWSNQPGAAAWTQIAVPEPFREVTVSSDGAVCGIAKRNNVYMYSDN